MAVIKGKFIYQAYYKSVEEMKRDVNLEGKFLVSVIEDHTQTVYQISSSFVKDAIRLDNGLYAVPVSVGNSQSSTAIERYTTKRPTDYVVGGVSKGTQFEGVPLGTVMDTIFFGNEVMRFTWRDNLTEEIHVEGENHSLRKIYLDITLAENKVVSYFIYRENDLKYSEDVDWVEGSYTIDVSEDFSKTTNIKIVLQDNQGNQVTVNKQYLFRYPVFYGIAQPGQAPTATEIKKWRTYQERGTLSVSQSLENMRMCIAIPVTEVTVERFYDENMFRINSVYVLWETMNVQIGTDLVKYQLYATPALTVDDYVFSFLVKELSSENN